MSPEKKIRQVEELTQGVQLLALSRLKQEDPDATDEVLKLRLAAYGRERLEAAGLL